MKLFACKVVAASAVFLAAYIACAAWSIDNPPTNNPITLISKTDALSAAGQSEIFGAKMRVTANTTGKDYEFDKDIMTEPDGGWSRDVQPDDSEWDFNSEYTLIIWSAPNIPKKSRLFDVFGSSE